MKLCEVFDELSDYTLPMRHVIRETITFIRIERWFVADDQHDSSELLPVAEHVVEQVVLTSAEEAQVRELFRRILEEQRRTQSDSRVRDHHSQQGRGV